MAPAPPPSTGTGTIAGTFGSRSDVGSYHGGHGNRYFDEADIWPLIGNTGDEPTNTSGKPSGNKGTSAAKSKVVDGAGIVQLYASLKQGQTVKQWYTQHTQQLVNIDIRRFITFGIIKGFLYRVHKYALATGTPPPSTHTNPTTATSSINGGVVSSNGDSNHNISLHNDTNDHEPPEQDDNLHHLESLTRSVGLSHVPSIVAPASLRSGDSKPSAPSITGTITGSGPQSHPHDSAAAAAQDARHHPHGHHHQGNHVHHNRHSQHSHRNRHHRYHRHVDSLIDDEDNSHSDSESIENAALAKYLDGMHCFDQICTDLAISERELTAKLKKWLFEVHIIHR